MSKPRKCRLDEVLVERGMAGDLDEARRLIMAGQVLSDDQRLDKAGLLVRADLALRLKHRAGRFVSRAGDKLAGALEAFAIDPHGLVCLDLGASTGGFTDCLLQGGALRVYAVDVGTNQLVWQLRNDPRVVCLERTHARDLDRARVPEPIDLLVVDVSFTSLRYVLPPVLPLLRTGARMICLFKPQFEVPREQVQSGGLVAEADAETVLREMANWCQAQGLIELGKIKSPVKGLSGNQEYLLQLQEARPD